MSVEALILELRTLKEREALEHRGQVQRWLAAAEIAVPAVLWSAEAGNLRCINAAREILVILGAKGATV